jgi:1,4-alpha-glucan branching enzyme
VNADRRFTKMSFNEYVVESSEYHGVHIHHQEVTDMAALEAVKKIRESISRPLMTGGKHEVEFKCPASMAKKVYIAGNFNDWNTSSMPMKKEKDGTWRIKLKLSPGKYEYKYFVDGAWAFDQSCSELVPNQFGTDNCVISVH